MNTIDYAVEFEYASMALLTLLLVLYCARRKYPGLSNIVYLAMVICTFLSALTHIFAIKSLPVADSLPLALNYVIHISYLIFYDLQGIIFLMYVNAVTKRNSVSKANRWFFIGLTAFEVLMLVTTPFTKLIIYFDENMQYKHGPLFGIYFVIAVLILIYASVIFVNYRKKLNFMQGVSIVTFEVLTMGATILQLLVSRAVVGNFVASLSLVMFLIVLQNPDDFTDKAADCYNYDAFFLSVEAKLSKKKPFSIAAFRFDGLNYISGLYQVSDRGVISKALATRLKVEFQTDGIYHLGSCEFAIFTNERRRLTEEYLAERIQRVFSRPVNIHGIEAVLTPKICLVRYPDFVTSPEDVRDAVEFSLKNSRKSEGSVFVASADAITAKKREMHILSTIKSSIVNKSFEMYYQPIYNPAEKGFVCAEALIRMRDNELGFISPEEFIPLAEANGMIIEISEIAFHQVCRFLKSGQAQKMGVKYIEVNLSVLQCVQEELADSLLSIMDSYGIPPEQINFEITETAGLANYDMLLKNMNTLISKGVTFSMDDYGTGFSTANYLISLPMEIVKIDKSILWPAMENQEAFVILRHTVEMLKSLKKKIVVEGVETVEMAQLLIDMGCDYLQGFYYQRPVPMKEYIAFLENNRFTGEISEKIQKTS